jgi:hypothetical protein
MPAQAQAGAADARRVDATAGLQGADQRVQFVRLPGPAFFELR